MEPSWTVPLWILAAWMVGSLPLGAWWVRHATGLEPRDVNPHLLGVENVFRLLGPHVAAVGFLLDVLKGAACVAALPAPGAAAVGVLAGHLYPPPWPGDARAPRGRGNGVLVGALAALALRGAVPPAAVWVASLAFAAALARWRYVTPATLIGLLLALLVPGTPTLVVLAWLSLLAVRGAPALARIADGTEARVGAPPAVRGLRPGRVRAAFMIHPMSVPDLWQARSQRWLSGPYRRGWLPEPLLRRALRWLRPQVYGVLRGVRLPDGRELETVLIGGPLLPDQIRSHPAEATQMAIRGAELAREMGAEAFGLGAYWSTVGDKGREVQAAVPDLPITHGGAYTAATVRAAIPGLLARYRAQGGTLARTTAAVVGANGVVAFGVARALAPEVGSLLLIGRDGARLGRSADTLRRKRPGLVVATSTHIADVARADLVFTATNEPGHVIRPEHVRPGAWIYDLGRPADVSPAVREVPGVELVPGGVVRPPGATRSQLDLHFGEGLVPACLAETMILAATGAADRASTGPLTRSEDVAWYLAQGERLGFEIVTYDARVARAPETA
ncbi:MAG: glycerol-3-phosphate acyltransferase [Trueperaceae bacterium]|nr:glycerol-3-phosphate acyltransferase [Trueperaceae bacterium]